jgi:chromosomal replication initiation ATPase DnaA
MFVSYFAFPGFPKEISRIPINRKIAIILDIVCDEYGLTRTELKSRCRKRFILEARQIAMYFMREITNCNYTNIGETFGQHHVTAMNGITQVNNMFVYDSLFKQQVDQINRKITIAIKKHINAKNTLPLPQ